MSTSGPVINEKAVAALRGRGGAGARGGQVLHCGGERLTEGVLDKGHFVAPTIAELPLESSLFLEELFVPFLAIGEVASLEQAIAESEQGGVRTDGRASSRTSRTRSTASSTRSRRGSAT